jgi:uncharacterized protein with PIN domain
MNWFKKKQLCVHCNKNKTRRLFEEKATCSACQTKILISREPERVCPVDGAVLLKEYNNQIIIDRCPQCSGIWLDAGEIEAIKEAARTEGIAVGSVLF